MNPFQDVFISYGRADSKQFAKYLNDRLVALGYAVWFDFDDIPLGVDYQKQIDDGIEKADNFVFIISPHSVNSPYCGLEIELALKHNKRIIPLLHVEQIDRDTWQQRFPQGTAEQWAAYTAAGKHSSFPNMHPEISKINWIYLREQADDPEAGFQGLLDLLERQKAYVHQHTVLLQKALEWERHHRQTGYLLIGEERQQAEAWLATQFPDSQPPCVPTDLHCELITESIKNANNLMTQVFLCHAEQDRDITRQIRQSLMRVGITTWTHHSDIEFGSDFQAAIARGLEEADNVVFLMSPQALASPYCQQELEQALALHKRIIPLQVAPVSPSMVSPHLQNLQYIDLTNNRSAADFQQNMSDLLRILKQDAAYYHEHKVLLTKALKWERQQRNPAVLLRGYELQHAQAWLKLAQQFPEHSPVPAQAAFIAASAQQPPGLSLDVFISYSRADSDFARKLNDGLQRQGKRTWFDQESIASGADFQQEIYRGIEASDQFLFILSPRSVTSPYCADEVEYAAKLNKRIVTVRYQAVAAAALHPELAKVQWIDFQGPDADFGASFKELLRTLDTDPEHLRFHTRVLLQAIAWDQKERRQSLLLRGAELQEAEQWLLQAAAKQPSPTPLQGEFVAASRKTATGQQRQRLGLFGTLFVLAVLGGTAWWGQRRAQQIAIGRSLTSQVLVLDSRTDRLPQQVLLAIEATRRLQQHGLSAADANPGLRRVRLLPLKDLTIDNAQEIAFSPDGSVLAVIGADGTTRLRTWDSNAERLIPDVTGAVKVVFSPDGTRLAISQQDTTVTVLDAASLQAIARISYGALINDMTFRPDSQAIAIIGEKDAAQVWQLQPQQQLANIEHDDGINQASFSFGGDRLATASQDNSVKIWHQNTNQEIRLLQKDSVLDVGFSADGKTLATVSMDGITQIWDLDTQQEVDRLIQDEPLLRAVLAPEQSILATANKDNDVFVWDLATGRQRADVPQESQLAALVFSPDGSLLATASGGTVRVWNLAINQEVARITLDTAIAQIAFHPDGKTLLTVQDNTAQAWKLTAPGEQSLLSSEEATYAAFSPDGQRLMTVAVDGTIRVWDRTTLTPVGVAATLFTRGVNDIALSPDGQRLAIASATGEVVVRDLETQRVTELPHDRPVNRILFSPDGRTLVTAGQDNRVRLWNLESGQAETYTDHQGWVNDVAFSPDGKTLATASNDNTTWVIDLATGAPKTILEHDAQVVKVAFSADGSRILTADQQGVVRIWQGTTGREVRSKPYEADGSAMGFSGDGSVLMTRSGDTVRIWQWATHAEVARHDSDRIIHVALSPDGSSFATVNRDGLVEIGAINPQALIEAACDRLPRNLTLAEWQQYVGANISYQKTCAALPAPPSLAP